MTLIELSALAERRLPGPATTPMQSCAPEELAGEPSRLYGRRTAIHTGSWWLLSCAPSFRWGHVQPAGPGCKPSSCWPGPGAAGGEGPERTHGSFTIDLDSRSSAMISALAAMGRSQIHGVPGQRGYHPLMKP